MVDPITDTELDQVEQLAKAPGYLVPTRMAQRIIARLRAADALIAALREPGAASEDHVIARCCEALAAWRAARGEAP